MSQNKLKEMNGDSGSVTMPTSNGNGNINNATTNGNVTGSSSSDLKARKAALTPLEYRVTQQRETERPFSNKYNKFWESGTYHCIVCDAELFKSETKFESKSGWPAFYNVVDPQRVKLTPDLSHVGANLLLLVAKPDLARTEVSCASCNAHLGHLFKDGPKPTGLRYCINSSSLNFRSSSDPEGNNGFPNGFSPSSLTNGNGTSNNSSAPREYICNPDNLCSRSNRQAFTPSPPPTLNSRLPGFNPPQQPHSLACTPTGAKEFVSKTSSARENFFSSFDNSMPPMGALCLNNQSCQRRPPTQTKTSSEEAVKKSIISNGAENDVITNGNTNGLKSSSLKVNLKPPLQAKTSNANANIRNDTGSSTVVPPTTSKTNLNLNTNSSSGTTTTTPVTSVTKTTKPRNPFSKGVSLTAARINFFQKIATSSKDSPSPPSRWATSFNARWSSSTRSPSSSSSNNTHHEQENMTVNNYNNDNVSSSSSGRFPSSCSSGSLCTVTKQPRPEDLSGPKRSTSSFFARTSISQTPTIEQISIAPKTVALRETTL